MECHLEEKVWRATRNKKKQQEAIQKYKQSMSNIEKNAALEFKKDLKEKRMIEEVKERGLTPVDFFR